MLKKDEKKCVYYRGESIIGQTGLIVMKVSWPLIVKIPIWDLTGQKGLAAVLF